MSEIEGAKNLSESVVEDSELISNRKPINLEGLMPLAEEKHQYLGSGLNMEIKKLQ